MRVTLGRWGMGVTVGGFVADLFAGDVYLKVPKLGELAWNCTGFHIDRAAGQRSRNKSGSMVD